MPSPRKYLVNLASGGRIVIVRSDGEECTPEERAWIAAAITNTLKSETPRLPPKRELVEDMFGVKLAKTKFGVEFQLDPMIHELDELRARAALTKKRVAELLFTTPNRVTDWVRGTARPHLEDIRDWGALQSVAPMLIPAALRERVTAMKQKYYEDQAEAQARAAFGDVEADDEPDETESPTHVGMIVST